MILESREEWVRELMMVGEPKYVRSTESKFLEHVDAKNDPMSFNRHNGNGDFTNAGMKMSKEFCLNIQRSRTGKSSGMLNKPHSDETKAKIAATKIGLNVGTKWFNNGLTAKRFNIGFEPAGWVLGKKYVTI